MSSQPEANLPPPPFPTRYPNRPPLALQRRARNGGGSPADWPQLATNANLNGNHEDAARFFRHLEAALTERERSIGEAEARLTDRARELDEMDALLRAREALLASTQLRHSGNGKMVTVREAEALKQLKLELDRQETSLRELRETLRAREKYLEECETRLFEKVQQQQEKETELEQREEDLHVRLDETAASEAPPKVVDEFRE